MSSTVSPSGAVVKRARAPSKLSMAMAQLSDDALPPVAPSLSASPPPSSLFASAAPQHPNPASSVALSCSAEKLRSSGKVLTHLHKEIFKGLPNSKRVGSVYELFKAHSGFHLCLSAGDGSAIPEDLRVALEMHLDDEADVDVDTDVFDPAASHAEDDLAPSTAKAAKAAAAEQRRKQEVEEFCAARNAVAAANSRQRATGGRGGSAAGAAADAVRARATAAAAAGRRS